MLRMSNYSELAKYNLWAASFALALLLIVLPIFVSIDSDALYTKGYQANGAFNRFSSEELWETTINVQNFFLDDEDLLFFSSAEAEHLEEVKDIFSLAKKILIICLFCVIGFVFAFVRFSFEEKKMDFKDKKTQYFLFDSFSLLAKRSSLIIFALLLILAAFAISWDWFFTVFHELLFSSQWQFTADTLMMQLWTHPFFVVAAKFLAVRIIIIALILFACSYALRSVQKKVKS